MSKHDAAFEAITAEAEVLLARVDWAQLTPSRAAVLRGLQVYLGSAVQREAGRVLYVQYALVRPVAKFLLKHMLR
jgi:hypothetical protein